MTDEPVPPVSAEPVPAAPLGGLPDERVRVDGPATKRKFDALPALYLLGFLVLAGALIYLYRHPALPEGSDRDAGRMETLRQQVQTLSERLSQMEARPAPVAPAPAPPPNLAPIEARIAALETRPAPPAPQPVDLSGLERRIAGLEQRPAPPPPPAVDLGPLGARVDAVTARQAADAAAITGQVQAVSNAVQGLAGRLDKTEAALAATAQRARLAGRLQAAVTALNAGQKLGDIPGAPPSVVRFAAEAPPTEASLRLSFDTAAAAASHASQPAIMDDQPFASRLWTRAQQSVTVRQGDRVLLGDPVSGVLAQARTALDAGDLAGAVAALNGLAGPAAAAMAGWTGQARALLDARAALAGMAAG